MKPSIFFLASSLLLGLLTQPQSVVANRNGGPTSLKIGETQLVRNGFGKRNKMMLSLYECSLYLPQKSNDAAAILAADESMAVRIDITSKFVSQAKMLAALKAGFKSSAERDVPTLDADIERFSSCFSDPIKLGDVFILAYTPKSGVVVLKNNQKKGSVPGLKFKKALMGIWLGKKPIDASLKTAMLGK
jgi:hypothetical protein